MSSIIFLAWAPHSMRAESISRGLGASLHTLSYKSRRKFYAPIKYPLLFYKTLRLLTSSSPTIIICQSPPIFCPLTAMVYAVGKRNKKIRIIVDAHTATFEKPWSHPILNSITKRVIRKALIVIVANAELQEIVSQNYGVKPLVLEDGVPQILNDVQEDSRASVDRGGKNAQTHLSNTMHGQDGIKVLETEGGMKKFKVAVICSFASDEPIEEIIEAAKILSETTSFFVTGDSSRLGTGMLASWEHTATNVLFTGFLEKREYFKLLKSVDAIMVLSKRYHNMLSGAHEALALEKPLITSDWPPLRNYFSSGTTYVNNSVKGIVNGVISAQLEKNRMREEMRILKQDKIVQWEKKISAFKEEFIDRSTKTV